MIALHVEASFPDAEIWKEFAEVLILVFENGDEDRMSVCFNGSGEEGSQQTYSVRYNPIPKPSLCFSFLLFNLMAHRHQLFSYSLQPSYSAASPAPPQQQRQPTISPSLYGPSSSANHYFNSRYNLSLLLFTRNAYFVFRYVPPSSQHDVVSADASAASGSLAAWRGVL